MQFIKIIASRFFNFASRCSRQRIYDGYRKRYNIHPSFIFNGEGILMYGGGKINIKENSYIGRYSLLQVSAGNSIDIGKGCKIGPFFHVWSESSCADDDYSGEITPKCGDITIGDYVWIGAGVLIAPGIKIGSNSIIGTNSVVTKDVPEYAIVGGVPAHFIRWKKCKKLE